MKVLLLVLSLISTQVLGYSCPLAPIPPLGCTAVCICDSGGCEYIYVCK